MSENGTGWRNRIVGHGEEAPDQLLANPRNWRIHPRQQQAALEGVLDDVGWVQDIIVNKQTGHVVDGHLRIQLALRREEPTVPVVYVDLDEHEEALILASIDPLSAMAAADKEQLDALLRDVHTDSPAVQQMIESLAVRTGVIPPVDFDKEWQGMPELKQKDLSAAKSIIVNFMTLDDMYMFAECIDQTMTEQTKSIWYPKKDKENLKGTAFVES